MGVRTNLMTLSPPDRLSATAARSSGSCSGLSSTSEGATNWCTPSMNPASPESGLMTLRLMKVSNTLGAELNGSPVSGSTPLVTNAASSPSTRSSWFLVVSQRYRFWRIPTIAPEMVSAIPATSTSATMNLARIVNPPRRRNLLIPSFSPIHHPLKAGRAGSRRKISPSRNQPGSPWFRHDQLHRPRPW